MTANNGKQMLIECGVVWAKLQKALDYNLDQIEGCLLTHEHKDHSMAIKDVLKAGILVYASVGTLEACEVLSWRGARAIRPRVSCNDKKGTFHFTAYPSNHDAVEPYMFTVQCDGECLLFATDTSHITARFNRAFDIIAIECSYDKNILQARIDSSDIAEPLAKRLLSSHMEKQTTKKYIAKYCDLSKCREIHLLHMSAENIDRQKTIREFEEAFFIKTV